MRRAAASFLVLAGLTLPFAVDAHAQGKDVAYADAVKKGERAYVARDFGSAAAAFKEATGLDPSNALAFYRLGEAELALENLDGAEAAWKSAQSKSADPSLAAKVLFVIADLRERQQKWQEAKDAWVAYTAFLQKNPKAVGYLATAEDRQKKIDRRVQMEKDYGAVKKRIEDRIKEVEAEAEKKAK